MLSSGNQVYASLRRFVPNSVDFPSKTLGNNQKDFFFFFFATSIYSYSGERKLDGRWSLQKMLQARFKLALFKRDTPQFNISEHLC